MNKPLINKIIFFFSLFIIVLSFNCCNKDGLKTAIQGSWVIDKMTYLNEPCIDAFLVNMINVNEGTMIIPVRKGYNRQYGMDSAYWTLKKNSMIYMIDIKAHDPLFDGRFQVDYNHKDKSKVARMTLTSDSVFISCQKTPELN